MLIDVVDTIGDVMDIMLVDAFVAMQMVHHSSFANSYNLNKDHILDMVGEWHDQIQYIEEKKDLSTYFNYSYAILNYVKLLVITTFSIDNYLQILVTRFC